MSDWVSPILVKELRQGLQARAFEWAFFLLQLLMLFSVIISVLSVASKHADLTVQFGEGMFWTLLSIPVLLVMPMRGCSALQGEIESRSLELIFLTRLSAWRIVVGKWGALFSQTCLLVCAVIPYAVLRYYLGSINLLADLIVIATLLSMSALLTAFTVSISSFNARLAKGMVIVFPIAVLMIGPSFVMGTSLAIRTGVSFFSHLDWEVYLGATFYGLAALIYLLEIGAARIAPPAENHAIRKRLIAFIILLSGPVALGLGVDQAFLWFPLVLAIPIFVDAMCKEWNPVPGIMLPLFRLKALGKLASHFLIPGWPSGALFTMVAFSLYGVFLIFVEQGDPEPSLLFLSLFGTILMPLAAVRVFFPQTRRVGTMYIVVQLVLFTFSMMVMVIGGLFDYDIDGILAVFPLSTLIMAIAQQTDSSWLIPTAASLIACVVIILIRSRSEWKEMRELKKHADLLRQGLLVPGDLATHPMPADEETSLNSHAG